MTVVVDLETREGCAPNCARFVDRWRVFWDEHTQAPVAIMVCDEYLDRLRPKSRAMVRQARRRYDLREFDIDRHAADVERVNHSKTATADGPTYGWLTQTVDPSSLPDGFRECCPIHDDLWFGGFDVAGDLRGYIRLIRIARLGVIHSIFRHAEHSTGVLNGLLAHVAEHADVDHVSYHTMDAAAHTGRPAFKERTGFAATDVRIGP